MVTRNYRFYVMVPLALLLFIAFIPPLRDVDQHQHFDGHRAYRDVLAQVAFGPRIPGRVSHALGINYIISELTQAHWQVSLHITAYKGFRITNIIASRDKQSYSPEILLGAHYDSRLSADQDVFAQEDRGVPGANDGASGVAVLLELARTLPNNTKPVWLVFFDAEDNGGLDGRDWIMGSHVFVAELIHPPQSVVIVDMIGDADLDIYIETNSDRELVNEIWEQASSLGFVQFHSTYRYTLIDDHLPFVEVGIQAIDIIDFDYPYWHTLSDTPDKVSSASLDIIGDTLWNWIVSK